MEQTGKAEGAHPTNGNKMTGRVVAGILCKPPKSGRIKNDFGGFTMARKERRDNSKLRELMEEYGVKTMDDVHNFVKIVWL